MWTFAEDMLLETWTVGHIFAVDNAAHMRRQAPAKLASFFSLANSMSLRDCGSQLSQAAHPRSACDVPKHKVLCASLHIEAQPEQLRRRLQKNHQ